MLMFEAFHNMYVLLKQAKDGTLDPESEIYKKTMSEVETILRKHGKDPEQIVIRDGSFVDTLLKLGE